MKTKKKKEGLHQKLKSFFPRNHVKIKKKRQNIIQRSDADQNQIIVGGADVDHGQIIGGIYPPQVLAPLLTTLQRYKIYVVLLPVQKFFGMGVWNGIRKKILVRNRIRKNPFLFHSIPWPACSHAKKDYICLQLVQS